MDFDATGYMNTNPNKILYQDNFQWNLQYTAYMVAMAR